MSAKEDSNCMLDALDDNTSGASACACLAFCKAPSSGRDKMSSTSRTLPNLGSVGKKPVIPKKLSTCKEFRTDVNSFGDLPISELMHAADQIRV